MPRLVAGFCALTAVLLVAGVSHAEPKRYALVVGVREYPLSRSLTPLEFTEPDATTIAGTLKDGGFEVTLMTQSASEGQNNRRFAPSADLIRKQFADLIATPFLARTDCVMVVLEGHGIQLPSRQDENKVTFYFCPADAVIEGLKHSEDVTDRHHLLPVQELYDTLEKSEAGVKLLVVDACRNDPNKPSAFRSAKSVTRPPLPVPPGGLAALFSCSASQQAAEDPDLKHGVFSYFLIEGLKGQADLDGNQQIDITELYQYVGNRTFTHVRQKYSTQQIPEFKGDIKGWAPLLAVNPASPVPTPLPKPLPRPFVPESGKLEGKTAGDIWNKNGLEIPFCWCPPGRFKMGSPGTVRERPTDEAQVDVTLSRGFWIGQFEVTQAEWKAVMSTTPWKDRTSSREGDKHPVTEVTWEEADEFCVRLTTKGHGEGWLPLDWEITLPTEAQWEYACRAGTTTRYCFGDQETQLGQYAWFEENADNIPGEKFAHPVGLKKPNAWNLHDMHGNVFEWCQDWHSERRVGGTDPVALKKATYRVLRGGGWRHGARFCGSAARYTGYPGIPGRGSSIGFRLTVVQTGAE